MNDIKEKLLQKIKASELKMIPRWQFIAYSILWGAATVVAGLIAVYLLSFILFFSHKSGILLAPLFGWAGIMLFIVSSPWILITILAVFLLALYVLVSHYAFSYQKPLIYSLVGSVLFVIAVSSIIQQTNFHNRAGDFVRRHEVPGFTPLYRNLADRPPKDVTRGSITEVANDSLVIITDTGLTFTVLITERTKLPQNHDFSVDENVIVFGPIQSESIKAFGILIDDGTRPPGGAGYRGGPSSSTYTPPLRP